MTTPDDLVAQAMTQSGFTKVDENGTPENVPLPETAPATPVAQNTPPAQADPKNGGNPDPEKPGAGDPPKTDTKPFDESAWLNEKFSGKFKSIDEVLNKLKDADDLSTKLTSAEQKAKDFETKLAQSPFANDYVKGLNDYISKGGDPRIYQKVAGLDPDKLTDKDALVLKYRFQHNMKKEDAEFKVARKYKLTSEVDETDPDVREARIDLQLDAQEAKKYLGQYKTDALNVPGSIQNQLKETQEKAAKQVQQRVESWKPHVPKLISDLSKITIPIDDKGEQTFTFEVPKESLANVEEHVANVLKGADIQPDAEGQQLMKQIAMREVYVNHFSDMVKTIVGGLQKKWAAELNHPSALREEGGGKASVEVDNDTSLAGFIAKSQGIKNFA